MLQSRLKELRARKRMSQHDLATVLSVSQQTVGSWEVGRSEPSTALLNEIASYFNVSVDYLIGRPEPEEPKDLKDIIRNQSMTFDGKPLSDRDVAVIESFLKTLKSE